MHVMHLWKKVPFKWNRWTDFLTVVSSILMNAEPIILSPLSITGKKQGSVLLSAWKLHVHRNTDH